LVAKAHRRADRPRSPQALTTSDSIHAHPEASWYLRRMKLVLFAALTLALAACSKSRCETYADMEVKCSGQSGAMVHDLAKQLCEAADKDSSDMMGKMFKQQADCATKHKECDAYKACLEKSGLD
jgi:hypothetical protein